MLKFRYKADPVLGVQRPDGSPTSENGKAFIKEITELGGVVSVIPNTNRMYLLREANEDRSRFNVDILGEILPGDWVLFIGNEGRLAQNSYVEETYEVIPG